MSKKVDAKCPKCLSEFLILEAFTKGDAFDCPYCATSLYVANVSPLVMKKED